MTIVDNGFQQTLYFSLLNEHWPPGSSAKSVQKNTSNTATHSVLFMQSGTLDSNGDQLKEGKGKFLSDTDCLVNSSNDYATSLRFVISRNAILAQNSNSAIDTLPTKNSVPEVQSRVLLCQAFITTLQKAIVRLDQVDFPPTAIAYKHTHPGAGIRYLINGGLELESEHGVQQLQAGEAWFEDRESPVQATAIGLAPSRFVRAMLLPLEFENRPTLKLVNAADTQKPRLQSNTRHIEQSVLIDDLY